MSNSTRKFFEKHILPLHQKQMSSSQKYLNQDFRTDEATYFSEPRHPEYLNLSTISIDSEDACKSYLQKCWADQPELLPLIPDLVKLAFTLKEEGIEQRTELSPYVYTMF